MKKTIIIRIKKFYHIFDCPTVELVKIPFEILPITEFISLNILTQNSSDIVRLLILNYFLIFNFN